MIEVDRQSTELQETETKLLSVFSRLHPLAKQDRPTLKKLLTRDPTLFGQLQHAPKRPKHVLGTEMEEIGCAWQAF